MMGTMLGRRTRASRRGLAQFPPPGSSTNPYAELLYAALAEHGFERRELSAPTVPALWRARREIGYLHFHWLPEKVYAPSLRTTAPPARAGLELCRFAYRMAFARLLGYRIAWTVHELRPRRARSVRARIDRAGSVILARSSHTLIAHDDAMADRLRAELGRPLAISIIPHGTFTDVYPTHRARAELRTELGIEQDAIVFLCFGQLRADKRVRLVLDAFATVRASNVHLVVAGVVAEAGLGPDLERVARADARVRLLLGNVCPERVGELFSLADVFVLARGEIWTSGSLILALSTGLPAVAARTPPAIQLLGDSGWLFTPGDAGALADAIRLAAADPEALARKRTAARARGQQLPSWEEVAGQTAGLLAGGLTGMRSLSVPGPEPVRTETRTPRSSAPR
jgi:beta-1,4-mannosyltransferase